MAKYVRNQVGKNWLFDGLSFWRDWGGVKQGRRKLGLTHLGVESLEARCLLAAVGGFLRTGGDMLAGAIASVYEPLPGDFAEQERANEVLVHASATAEYGDEYGFGFEHRDTTGLAPTPIGGSIAVPQISSAGTYEAAAFDYASAGFVHSTGTYGTGEFLYNADPEFSQNLVFHGHLFVAASGGSVESGNAGAGGGVGSVSWIGQAALVGGNSSVSWYNIPGLDDGSAGGANHHIHFTIPIGDGAGFQFGSWTNGDTGAWSEGEGSFAETLWTVTGATWGYVTGEGQDLQDGDFDGDGDVDGDDFDVWAEGKPQADADDDGDIDDDDLAIWVANTNELVVSTEVDESDGNYTLGDLSLREAIFLAGDANHPGRDKIYFAPWVDEIVLNGEQLSIDNGNVVDMVGPGMGKLQISGNNASRVLNIGSGGSVTISGLTIRDGNAGNQRGGGIYTSDTYLILIDVRLTENHAARGGGIYKALGDLSIVGSQIDSNVSSGVGGGIVIGSTGRHSIESSAIVSNQAGTSSGGLFILYGSMAISNTTISSNYAATDFGGINLSGGAMWVANSTVANNSAGSGNVGGLYVYPGISSATIDNTIIINNDASGDVDIVGSLQQLSSYNLLRAGASGGLSNTNGNKVLAVGQSAGLGPLDFYGGPTKTHKLFATSPAVDAGDNAVVADWALVFDQRGPGFDRIADGGGGPVVDIGAFEYGFTDFGGSGSGPLMAEFQGPPARSASAVPVPPFGALHNLDLIDRAFAEQPLRRWVGDSSAAIDMLLLALHSDRLDRFSKSVTDIVPPQDEELSVFADVLFSELDIAMGKDEMTEGMFR